MPRARTYRAAHGPPAQKHADRSRARSVVAPFVQSLLPVGDVALQSPEKDLWPLRFGNGIILQPDRHPHRHVFPATSAAGRVSAPGDACAGGARRRSSRAAAGDSSELAAHKRT
eukprot:4066446-Prymnesium_polylepis.2